MTQRSRLGRRVRTSTLVFLSAVSLVAIAYGTYFLWEQHSGVTARMTVVECHKRHRTGTVRHPIRVPWNPQGDSCFGAIVDTPRTYETSMHISGAYVGDVGHDIDVHVHVHEAVADKWSVPPIAIGVGCALAVGVLIVIVRRRRNSSVPVVGPKPDRSETLPPQ
jgi:hypothetical protein